MLVSIAGRIMSNLLVYYVNGNGVTVHQFYCAVVINLGGEISRPPARMKTRTTAGPIYL